MYNGYIVDVKSGGQERARSKQINIIDYIYTTHGIPFNMRAKREYLYKKKVKLNEQKINEHLDALNRYKDANKYKGSRVLRSEIRKAIRTHSVEETFGVEHKTYDSIPKIAKRIFEKNKGVFEFESNDNHYKVSEEDYQNFTNDRNASKSIEDFNKTRKEVGSLDVLPIFHRTEDYIEFDKGVALVSILLGYGYKHIDDSLELIKYLKDKLKGTSIEVVNQIEQTKTVTLNLLCDNELVDDVMTNFMDLYKVWDKTFYRLDLPAHIRISYNKGQDNEKVELYYIINGHRFSKLKDDLTLRKETYKSLEVYE